MRKTAFVGSIRLAAALCCIAVASAAMPADADPRIVRKAARTDFDRLVRQDPTLRVGDGASPASGLAFYRTIGSRRVAGYLEPNEGIVGRCGGTSYAAVPLDSGTPAGIAGWLLFRVGDRRHVAVVDATEGLEFRDDRMLASNLIGDPFAKNLESLHRVDSIACRASGFKLLGSHVIPSP